MKKYIIKIFSLFVLIFYANNFSAQNIELINPSFEGIPRVSTLPDGWRSRGTPGYSYPDTQPNETFKVSKSAQDGNTYIGMVTRADDSHEAIIQRLETPLIGGQCYQFTCHLARSNSYLSGTRYDPTLKQHTQPIKLQVLGANSFRGDSTVLYVSPAIDHTEWKEYTIKLKPKEDYTYFILQAYYVTPVLFPYIGNILLDNCSTLEWVSCDKRSKPLEKKKRPKKEPKQPKKPKQPTTPEEEEIVYNIPPKKPKTPPAPDPTPPKEEVKTPPPTPTPPPPPELEIEKPAPPSPPKSLAELDANSIVEGLVMEVKNINFATKSAELTDNSIGSLNEIYDFLKRNPEIVVEIGGHTNLLGSFAYSMDLSQQRAASVVRYLIEKGIDKKRIGAKGYGQTEPLIEGVSNTANQTNQRVEIKIISTGK